MDTSEYIFSMPFSIKSYDADCRGLMSIQALTSIMQETAVEHCEAVNKSARELYENKLGIVLSRIKTKILEYPRWGDRITMQTWSPGLEKVKGHREFRMLDAASRPLSLTSSLWFLFDMANNRFGDMQALFKDYIGIHEERALPEKLLKLSPPDDFDSLYRIEANYSDIDFYQHVNNIKYIDWMIDRVPADIRSRHVIETIEINYFTPVTLGDIVLSKLKRTDEEGIVFFHYIQNEKDGTPVAAAKTAWKEWS